MTDSLRLCGLLAALLAAAAGWARQDEAPNGVFLVAKPGLTDPNFSETVVLVTQTADSSTVGVILNRPTTLSLRQLLPEAAMPENYREPVFFGGPVMRQAVVALIHSESAPAAPAFHVLRDVYMTMHPDNILALLADGSRRYRLFAGFAGWVPLQLESEFRREGWYVLPADAQTIFRTNPQELWQELLRRALARPVRFTGAPQAEMKSPAAGGAGCPDAPGGAARAAFR